MRSMALASVTVPTVERGSPEPLLIHEDCCGQALKYIYVGTREGWHEALDEGGVGFIDHALGFGGNGAKDQ